ncbi:MAG: DUF2325 domain-containing protein [Bacilli bacterium]
MDRQAILAEWKDEMHALIDRFDFGQLDQVEKEFTRYMAFVHALARLPDPVHVQEIQSIALMPQAQNEEVQREEPFSDSEQNDQSERSLQTAIPDESVVDNQAAPETEEAGEPVQPGGVFSLKRQLSGGLAGPYFVPEKIIRRLGLEHGDEVDVQARGDMLPNGNPALTYTLHAAGARIPLAERIEHSLCLVRREDESWFVDDFPILSSDREKFDLEPGDVVDIAAWEHEPDQVRVVWKYETTMPSRSTKHKQRGHAPKDAMPAPPPRRIRSASPPKVKVAPKPMKSPLTGQHVVMVSGLPKESYYRKMFAQVGAECVFLTGDEKKETLIAAIRHSDIVVLITSAVSHKAAFQIGRLCKELKVAYRPVSRGGLQSVLQAAMEAQRTHRTTFENAPVETS